MMAEFEGRTLCVGYFFEETPDLSTETSVDHVHDNMMATNLAVRLIPDFGKDVPQLLMAQASQSYSASSAVVARERISETPYPSRMPIGSGNRRSNKWRRFYNQAEVIKTDCSNTTMTVGDIDHFFEDFKTFLSSHDGDIVSFTIKATSGLLVSNEALSSTLRQVTYNLEATDNVQGNSGYETVSITITTFIGRVKTVERRFKILQKAII